MYSLGGVFFNPKQNGIGIRQTYGQTKRDSVSCYNIKFPPNHVPVCDGAGLPKIRTQINFWTK